MATVPTGRNLRSAITGAELTEFYATQRLTIEEIAAKFGVAATTIARRFKDLGIRARRRGPLPGMQRGDSFEGGFEWRADLAYVVGLITTDGCLSRDGRHLTITSKDVDLLETARRCLGITARITQTTNPRPCYRLQWSDILFYRWLTDIGLMPAKSLRLGPLAIPDEWFRDFLRGCIDGDGSILTYTDRYNASKSPKYIYTRVYVSLVSASPPFIEWLRASVQRLHQLSGMSACANLRDTMTYGVYDMRNGSHWHCCAGLTTRRTWRVFSASASWPRLFLSGAQCRWCDALVGRW